MPSQDTTIPIGFCQCGCGQRTNLATFRNGLYKPGQPMRYVYGHQVRTRTRREVTPDLYTVDPETGCHRWNGGHFSDGYGRVGYRGKSIGAHVWAYETLVGPIPEGKELDHVRARGCVHKDCINLDHLEPVTCATNNQRRKNAKLTMEKAREIRALRGKEATAITAARYGVSDSMVGYIQRGKVWKE